MSSLAYSQWIRNQLLVPLNWIRHSAYSVGISTQAEAPPPVIVFPGPCWLCADRPDITCTHGQRWLPGEKPMKNSEAQKAFKIDLLLDLTESDDLTLQSQPYRTEFLLLSVTFFTHPNSEHFMCIFNRWALQGPLDFNRYSLQRKSKFGAFFF